jgi:hypothetical protein
MYNEPLDRLEQRALDVVRHGIASFKRLLRTLPKWMRKGGKLDLAKAIAAVSCVQTALATMSPVDMQRVARKHQSLCIV